MLLRGLCRSLVEHERIKTTEAKAKKLRPVVEKMITRARQDTLANRRQIARHLDNKNTKKLFSVIAPRYRGRKGGYTRIIKLGPRKSDSAREAIIEFVK